MLPPSRVTLATSGRTILCAAMKSSTDLERSYSLPIQYGGEVIVRSTHASGILWSKSSQSPMYSVVGVPALSDRTACVADLYVRTGIKSKHRAFRAQDPVKTCDSGMMAFSAQSAIVFSGIVALVRAEF